jgi:hypothetical protein
VRASLFVFHGFVEEKNYDTSIMHGHSGTSDLFILVWYGHMNKQAKAKTTFDDS